MVEPQSIVHWFPDKECHKCGYCKNTTGSTQYGMWAQTLTVGDYQDLIDRGWRRSGQYCYKPVMDETCCPLYTIRCNSLDFHMSKSQKKVVKKLNKFLKTGVLRDRDEPRKIDNNDDQGGELMSNCRECPVGIVDFTKLEVESESNNSNVKRKDIAIEPNVLKKNKTVSKQDEQGILKGDSNPSSTPKVVRKGLGADPNKPQCKKAKLLRLEKKLKKLEEAGQSIDQQSSIEQKGKSLEELMGDISADDKHKLTTRLILPSDPFGDWKEYEMLEYELFKKYQEVIHNDEENSLQGFRRFLVNSPLQRQVPKNISKSTRGIKEYGSYHQQYWLDDKLIAVGVIDILPKCVSAVYFFYDPDYRELTLGTYGALREIQLARELFPTLQTEFYYMGYYIHSCMKMRYKGNMNPSFLLCPETYIWFPIQECLEKLEKTKYCRFNEDIDAVDEKEGCDRDLDFVKIIHGNRLLTYPRFKRVFGKEDVYRNIRKLVGRKCITTLFFVEQ